MIVSARALTFVYENGFGYDTIVKFNKYVKMAEHYIKTYINYYDPTLEYLIYIDMYNWMDGGGEELCLYVTVTNRPNFNVEDRDFEHKIYIVNEMFEKMIPELDHFYFMVNVDRYNGSGYRDWSHFLEQAHNDGVDISEAAYYI